MLLTTKLKNKILTDLAGFIAENKEEIIRQNQIDLDSAENLDATLIDRLKLDGNKVYGMVKAIEEVIHMDDPQGKILSTYQHPNGMTVQNKTVPFGRILIIYESRPDVTIEAAINAFKAGNKILLKGGKEAKNTNLFLVSLWQKVLKQNNISNDFITYLNINREQTQLLLKDNTHNVDLVIPRGGDELIEYVQQNSSVPVIVSGRGNNFVYIHDDADFEMAVEIVLNGKSRLSVCNAIDKVLFNSNIANLEIKIATLSDRLNELGIDVYGAGDFLEAMGSLKKIISNTMWDEEFLAPKILFGVSASLRDAIATINAHSGGHSSVIVTASAESAAQFMNEVDSAAVYHNASSRFTDGGQFGFGAEMAISTQKLHFRGPIGLAQLVSNKWFIKGTGQVRD